MFTITQAPTKLVALALMTTAFHPTTVLTNSASGGAIAAQSVTIKVGTRTICTVKTDATGTARCAATIMLTPPFTATFAGGPNYLASSGNSP